MLGAGPAGHEGRHLHGAGSADPAHRAGIETPLPITFLFTSDEEIGSHGTRALIEEEAKTHKYVLVPEPGLADKGVTTGRYAIARYKLTAYGRRAMPARR